MKIRVFLAACAALAGCDDESDDQGTATGGTLAAPWNMYCTATFTRDFPVDDGFGDVVFTAAKDSTYLLSDLGGPFGDAILLLSAEGAVELDLEYEGDPPFETNCDPEATQLMYGVFRDVVLYQDVGLTEEACRLTADTAVPTTSAGFSLAGDINLGEASVYEVQLGGLSARCGDRDTAFMSVGNQRIGTTEYQAFPILAFRGPE